MLKRTMAEKNGESTPRLLPSWAGRFPVKVGNLVTCGLSGLTQPLHPKRRDPDGCPVLGGFLGEQDESRKPNFSTNPDGRGPSKGRASVKGQRGPSKVRPMFFELPKGGNFIVARAEDRVRTVRGGGF